MIDICIIAASYYVAQIFVLEDVFHMTAAHIKTINYTILIAIVIYQIFFNLFSIYRNITRYESGKDYFSYILACLVSCNVISMLNFIFNLHLASAKENLLAAILAGVDTYFLSCYDTFSYDKSNLNSQWRNYSKKKEFANYRRGKCK